MEAVVYLNGDYMPLSQATVSVMDRGFLLADGVYDVVLIYQGRPFHANLHFDRLRHSLAGIGLQIDQSDEDLEKIMQTLIMENEKEKQQRFYIQITRGVDRYRRHSYDNVSPTVFARVQPLEVRDLTAGVKVILQEDIRWHRCDIKSINRLSNVLMAQQAAKEDAEETLIVHDHMVLEGATSNVFIVKNNVVYTPPLSHDLLGGITRKVVFAIAKNYFQCQEKPVTQEELLASDEVWITSSSRGVVPVIQVDDHMIGAGIPGSVYQRIRPAYVEELHALLTRDG